MRIYNRIALILRELILVIQAQSKEERTDILIGAGTYQEDTKSHVHVRRNAGHDT